MVVITSDHGEQFGEHGRMGHINSLYVQALHVPLIIVPPEPLRQGLRVTESVSLADLPATVVTLAGLDQAPFPGASLTRFWSSDSTPGQASPAFAGTHEAALFRNGWHYIRTSAGEELYHLDSDREELHDLAASGTPPEMLARLRREVDSLLAASGSPKREMVGEPIGDE